MAMQNDDGLLRACVAEFFALFIFVFISCGSALVTGANVVSISLTFGFTILVLAHCTGHISGGHINPAVTIALAAFQKISPKRAGAYIVSQVLGAIFGAGILYACTVKDMRGCLGSNAVAPSYEVGPAFGLEVVLTFVLVLTVFATIDPKNAGNPLGAFPIAMAVMIAHLIAIPLTGCGINPARSLGPAVISQSIDGCDNVLDDHWLFWIAPIIGGLLAGGVYQFVLDDTMGKAADAKPSAGGKDTTMVERL